MSTYTVTNDCPEICQKLEFCVDAARLWPAEIDAIQAALNSAYRAGLDAALADVAEASLPEDEFAWLDDILLGDELAVEELAVEELADYVLEIETDLDNAFAQRDKLWDATMGDLARTFLAVGDEIDAVGNFALEVKSQGDADAAWIEALEARLGDLAVLVSDLSSRVRHLESGPLL